MPKISVVTPEKARAAGLPVGMAGDSQVTAYLEPGQFPLQLYLHEISSEGNLGIEALPVDCVVYVWSGSIRAGGCALAAGSSIVVEQGQTIEITGDAPNSRILTFAASTPSEGQESGRTVHILPVDRVPRSDNLGTGVGGAMHADSGCPTCNVWLHENHFPSSEPLSEEQQKLGIHSHSEDEIIFVIDGEIRLGNKLCGPGTALAIAADTLYSFAPGPHGLSFINFRADKPGDIQFAAGHSISETGYWAERLPRPDYLEPA